MRITYIYLVKSPFPKLGYCSNKAHAFPEVFEVSSAGFGKTSSTGLIKHTEGAPPLASQPQQKAQRRAGLKLSWALDLKAFFFLL
ncbi:hypothetical protein [Shewanella acanthi]|uniref:hypothetical protein n=1 Tax=Shewanella acanthi TaxID=2864212 RepID=UPI001C65E896|nr:hypothetical protein [Shewanella acanthi]QYJ78257.1 hypothetical protein K0H61_14265 [Shewanella acanthi]